jgi:hypothetical protein
MLLALYSMFEGVCVLVVRSNSVMFVVFRV